jgi:hypothetical protein
MSSEKKGPHKGSFPASSSSLESKAGKPGSPSLLSGQPLGKGQRLQRKKKGKPGKVARLSLPKYRVHDPVLQTCIGLLNNSSTHIESKDGRRTVFDEEVLTMARGLLSGKAEFPIRLWNSGAFTITTNVVAGAVVFSPIAAAEWTSIAALFDQYRVDHVRITFCPVIVAGNTGMNWAQGGYATGANFSGAATPTGVIQVLSLAESKFHPLSAIYTVGSTSTNATAMALCGNTVQYRMPWEVELTSAATVADASWIDPAVAWPGGCQFYGVCNGTNSDTPMYFYTEYFVRVRLRH